MSNQKKIYRLIKTDEAKQIIKHNVAMIRTSLAKAGCRLDDLQEQNVGYETRMEILRVMDQLTLMAEITLEELGEYL